MNTWIIPILTSLIGALLMIFISVIFKPWTILLLKLFRNKESVIEYHTFRGQKIIKFPSKGRTRVSVGVLACIEDKNGELLLIKKGNQNGRQDNLWKPLGGAIKISKKIKEQLVKRKYKFESDNTTKYRAKKDDLRIWINISDNKIINKALNSETNKYYASELKREISEELEINDENYFKKLFSISKEPISMNLWFRTEWQSPLRNRDYLHQIIYNIKIENIELLNQKIKSSKKLKWIDLSGNNNKNEIAITSYWLKEKNKFKSFKNE